MGEHNNSIDKVSINSAGIDNIKFIKDPLFLIFKRIVIVKIQNSKSKRSVDIKKDETLAAGIDKKLTEQTTELFFDKLRPKQRL